MNKYIFIILIFNSLLFYSCEEEFVPDSSKVEQQYIVEGYVESSDRPRPTYVILTKSIPFFSEIGIGALNNIFVKNATIKVSDGNNVVELTHFCLDDLPEDIKPLVKSSLGLDSINTNLNFCAYIDLQNQLSISENKRYDLNIQVDNKTITATTTIPRFVPLDSLWTDDIPGETVDTLRQLFCRINDPVEEKNFYRFKNGYTNQPIVTPIVSVIADPIFNGKNFAFPMDRAVTTFHPDSLEANYFKVGDSIQVQWMCIDQEQYEFWNTLELDRVRQGPFSNYIRAKSNVNGALGVWSGMSSKIYKIECK